jgi:hypothetical protein
MWSRNGESGAEINELRGAYRAIYLPIVRPKPEIDHKLLKLAFPSYSQKASLIMSRSHVYNSGYLGLAALAVIKRLIGRQNDFPLLLQKAVREFDIFPGALRFRRACAKRTRGAGMSCALCRGLGSGVPGSLLDPPQGHGLHHADTASVSVQSDSRDPVAPPPALNADIIVDTTRRTELSCELRDCRKEARYKAEIGESRVQDYRGANIDIQGEVQGIA